ncbi:hypothetical protein [Acinetobacter radioresistens]|nr:hypothetical protein [Acinetobacter radioresistens]EXF58344.1 hypothetical protein J502_0533 [Acinetobacter sp. 1294596]MCM1952223.1 hypothetical protein [Acinetobacter radioresistens]MCU4308065.1 hypothetical protein [Acinetobacter radioresistens]MCU4566512.1 hypothetical protein [Acinetobacter radioresistens]
MKPELHDELLKAIKELKQLTSTISLESLINFISMRQFEFNHGKSTTLSSPFQQGTYLLGLAASQEEPTNPTEFNDHLDKKISKLLNRIFSFYTLNYFDVDKNNENDKQTKLVVMSAFIHYFFTSKTLNSHQIKEWIFFWFKDYSTILQENYKFSVEDLLSFSTLLEDEIQNNFDERKKEIQLLDLYRQRFLEKCDEDIANFPLEMQRIKDDSELQGKMKNFFDNSLKVFSVPISKISDKFESEKLDNILNVFSLKRGDAEEIIYLTDKNPIQFKSLFIDKDRIYYVANNSFFIAIINFLENFLYKEVKSAQKNIQNRDKKLESKTTELFKRLCSSNAEFYESAFQNANSTNEHDLVIYDNGVLLIVEAKASPPKEPMRDAEKAFIKIRDHFKSSAGLQKAFDQANSLKNRVLDDQKLTLFTKKGKLLIEIPLVEIKVIHTICVTRDDFGALGCNLNYLLDKQEGESYPWVIDIANLDSIVQAWDHLELNYSDFYEFLSQRNQLHNKVISMDELEYVGAYLKYQGGLKGFISAKADYIPLTMKNADIFDEIYFKTLADKKYELKKISLDLQRLKREDLFGHEVKEHRKKVNRKPKSKIQKKSRKVNRK